MSKNSHLDILGESHIPSDLLTPTLGSNYGMPEFEDLAYGMGVLEGVLLPEHHEPPALPTGLTKSGGNLDLTDVIAENPITDLSWLDPQPAQDPSRLPHSDVAEVIPELEALWGNATNGVTVFPNNAAPAVQERVASREQLVKVATHAMRRVVVGHDMDVVVREAMESVGASMGRLAPVMKALKDENGLLGNVYVRASAYPNWGGGKWSKEVRKQAKNARYILVSERDVEQATWIQNGRCGYTGKLAVTQIPWDEAFSYYEPRLRAAGRSVDASEDPRQALKDAFLQKTDQRVAYGESLPVYKAVGDGVSLEEARSVFKEADSSRREVQVTEEVLRGRVQSWVVSRTLTRKQAKLILDSPATPNQKMKVAVKLASANRGSVFSGSPNLAADSRQELISQRLSEKKARVEAHEKRLLGVLSSRRTADIESRVASVIEHIDRGARGSHLRKIIAKEIPREYAKDAIHLLAPILKKTGALNDAPNSAPLYDGVEFVRAQPERKPIELSAHEGALAKAASSGDTTVSAIRGILGGVRRAMSEGMAGNDLTEFIRLRFTERLASAADGLIQEVRLAHEGGSGFLYVDAEAYASPQGVSGCERGALKHRANQVPAVMEMSRCASCSLARTLEDGSLKCATYNKSLLQDSSGPEFARLKKANISSANMSDAEATANLFAPTYDPSEFSLHNANLHEVELLPDSERMVEVTFGGWDI